MMFSYPLGKANIYINNHDLSEFKAKLVTSYAISGYEITNSYHQGPGRSSFSLFKQTYGLLRLTLPLEFFAGSKSEVMEYIAKLHAQLDGIFEVTLSDGFYYTCMVEKIGETTWMMDEWCTADYAFLAVRHKEPVTVESTTPLTIYNAGTWPMNDCIITLKGFTVTSNTPVVLSLSDMDGVYLSWEIDVSSGVYTGGDLVLDGINRRNLYNEGNIPTGTMGWTDYPYIKPGQNTIRVSGGLTATELEVYYVPAYL